MGLIVGTSLKRLLTVEPAIQEIIHSANKVMELSVLCGRRVEEEQNKAYADGWSKVEWPGSAHNIKKKGQIYVWAVDVIPCFLDGKSAYDWEDRLAFARLAGIIQTRARDYGLHHRWGGDFNENGRSLDEDFLDLPHHEFSKC